MHTSRGLTPPTGRLDLLTSSSFCPQPQFVEVVTRASLSLSVLCRSKVAWRFVAAQRRPPLSVVMQSPLRLRVLGKLWAAADGPTGSAPRRDSASWIR